MISLIIIPDAILDRLQSIPSKHSKADPMLLDDGRYALPYACLDCHCWSAFHSMLERCDRVTVSKSSIVRREVEGRG